MKGPIVVTGAAGRLGRALCGQFAALRMDIRAADQTAAPDRRVPIQTVNMLDASAVEDLVSGAWAVVHLANYAHASAAEARRLLNENVSMNMNVFHSAHAAGVRTFIFASSIQVVSGSRTAASLDSPTCLDYLPLDSQVPAKPGNAYALSKQLGEMTLRYYVDQNPVTSGTCMRFPMLLSDGDYARYACGSRQAADWEVADQAFAMLRYSDAARLILAVLKSPRAGFRTYLPAGRQNLLGQPAATVIRHYYPGVALRRPIDRIDCLVDIDQITAETGWQPQAPASPAAADSVA